MLILIRYGVLLQPAEGVCVQNVKERAGVPRGTSKYLCITRLTTAKVRLFLRIPVTIFY